MILIEILLFSFALMVLIPASVLFLEVLSAIPRRQRREVADTRRPSIAVLMPAHDEALLIGRALNSIMPQLTDDDRILVVADNCNDGTDFIAEAAGAEVIERTDDTLTGKGYALDFGIQHLRQNPPEVVLIIDSDCEIESGAIERLAKLCLQANRPVQSLYLMYAPPGAGLMTRIATFAWLVKNKVRPLGLHRANLPCQLMGTGMAFPWTVIDKADLASGHIVEDLQLGIDLARANMPPEFCPEARVRSRFPSTPDGIAEQRRRWEHGHLGMMLGTAPRLFIHGLVRGDLRIIALAADLCVPPLALLMLMAVTALTGNIGLLLLGGTALPLWLAAGALTLSIAAVLLAWAFHGRTVTSLGDMACAPFYALRKIPLYLKFIVDRQSSWIRTGRDVE